MVEDICVKCNVGIIEHTEENCLRTQLAQAKLSIDDWKNSWYNLREIIGRLSWEHHNCPYQTKPEEPAKPNHWFHENETIVQQGKLVYAKHGVDWKLVAAGTSEDAAKAVVRLMKEDSLCPKKSEK